MLELADALLPALDAGEAVAVVTVTAVARSAPRGPGAAMAVRRDGSVVGSISGGCVEGDAVMLALGVLATGRVVAATLGFTDDAAHAAGLACGGSVDVLVHRVDPDDLVARAVLSAPRTRTTRVGVVASGPEGGRLIADPDIPAGTGTRMLPSAYDGADLFVIERAPRPHLVLVGAGEHAMALARLASAAGYRVSVCDVWERLVTRERFPTADRIVVGLPAEHLVELLAPAAPHAAVCVLSHDERVDVPALAAALRLGAGFVGAMGARATVTARARVLAADGVPAADIDRIRAPLGIDLGDPSPEGTAVAVLAEITAARFGGTTRPLRDLTGPIHRRVEPSADSCAVPAVTS
ncbi:XdhC family protein [Microbacterium sp. RD1]|uniref:XdhC family protein n=1 Tax=Microbacterium sp. RD1 TaxID=3457313 RepID=UPI003FA5EA03